MAELAIFYRHQRFEQALPSGGYVEVGRQEHEVADSVLQRGQLLQVRSRALSQRHVSLRHTETGCWVVEDLGSTNGTWLRLAPQRPYEVSDCCELLLPDGIRILLRSPGGEAATGLEPFHNISALLSHVRNRYADQIREIQIVPSAEARRVSADFSRIVLWSGEVMLVRWRSSTVNLDLDDWLHRTVALINSQQVCEQEVPWRFVAGSPGRLRLFEMVRKIAGRSCTVLLIGPPGCGKEVLAEDLHNHSPRRERPFVPINCAALPRGLIESELFGHVANAFNDAKEKPGLFEKAHGGTLLLDEIGELPLDVQPKLLRVLQERKVRRVGGKDDRPIDVRLIAATNRNLLTMVREGAFREDLYSRLNVVPLHIPKLEPLDVAALVPILMERMAGEGGRQFDPQEIDRLVRLAMAEEWPANVRDLQNMLQRFDALFDENLSIEDNWHDLCKLSSSPPSLPPSPSRLPPSGEIENWLSAVTHTEELLFLRAAMELLIPYRRGAQERLACRLGMTSSGVCQKLRRLGIKMTDASETVELRLKHYIEEEQQKLAPYLPVLRSVLQP